MSKAIPIHRIDFDQVKRLNDELAVERNTPKIQFPSETKSEASTPVPVVVAPALPAPQPPSAPVHAKEPTVHVSVQLPAYLAKALKLRVATDGGTLRYFITRMLKEKGFHVDDADLIEDGRRLR